MAIADSTAPVEYRLVPGFPKYRVGSDGSVWSKCLAGRWIGPWKLLYHSLDPKGYPRVILCNNGIRKRMRVHRLVLEVFVGPSPEGMESCHKNDIKTDCRLENLRWGTNSSNKRDAISNGRAAGGSRKYNAKLTEANIIQIVNWRRNGRFLKWIALRTGVSIPTLCHILSGKTWKHVPR